MVPYTVVTGASRGLGRALARTFGEHGNNVLLVARNEERLKAAAARVATSARGRIEVLALDLASEGAIAKIDKKLDALNGYCDILINNAGLGYAGAFSGQDEDALRRLIAVNIDALSRLMRHFLPGMLTRGRGGILNVASLGGYVPGPHQAAYYASKAYVIALTEAVAAEVAGQGVRVCALAPGPIATGFHAAMGAEEAYYLKFMGLARAQTIARAAYREFYWGRTIIVPGLIPSLIAIALRFLPHPLSVPIVGWLLRPDRGDKDDA